jgi:hypothetical protein
MVDHDNIKRIRVDRRKHKSNCKNIYVRTKQNHKNENSKGKAPHRKTFNASNASQLVSFIARVNLCPGEPQYLRLISRESYLPILHPPGVSKWRCDPTP